jgi:hypothetical protein
MAWEAFMGGGGHAPPGKQAGIFSVLLPDLHSALGDGSPLNLSACSLTQTMDALIALMSPLAMMGGQGGALYNLIKVLLEKLKGPGAECGPVFSEHTGPVSSGSFSSSLGAGSSGGGGMDLH